MIRARNVMNVILHPMVASRAAVTVVMFNLAAILNRKKGDEVE